MENIIPSGANATRLIAEMRERIEMEIIQRWQAAERFEKSALRLQIEERFEKSILESLAHKPKFGKTLDAIERQAIEKALDENGGDKPATIKQLGISRASFYERCKRWGIALALCLCVSVVHAAPAKYAMLKWDTGMSNFVVKVGADRDIWTNQFTVTTNQFRLTNGLHYGIYGVFTVPGVITNATCFPVYWPSNPICEMWLVGYGTNLINKTNTALLLKYKGSAPPGNMRFWGIETKTTGWE